MDILVDERLINQLELIEKAQEQAMRDHDYEYFVQLSAQYLAIAAFLADM